VRFVEQPHLERRSASDVAVESLVGPQRETRPMRMSRAGTIGQVAAAGLIVALALGTTGCLGDLVPYAPPAAAASPDGGVATAAAATATGQFATDIMPDLVRLGCPACHNGGPPLKLIAAPANDTDWASNYSQLKARASSGDQSLVLTKNLSGSGIAHAGGAPFTSTADATYIKWLAWINAGAPQ
jgi:hypothetical protein